MCIRDRQWVVPDRLIFEPSDDNNSVATNRKPQSELKIAPIVAVGANSRWWEQISSGEIGFTPTTIRKDTRFDYLRTRKSEIGYQRRTVSSLVKDIAPFGGDVPFDLNLLHQRHLGR